ncbi:MAG: fibronectin type III domain-containing protein [Candidatus Thiodiazotropha sp.]
MPIRITLLLILLATAVQTGAVELEISPQLSTSGTFNLSWQGAEGERYRLFQLDADASPRLIYQGTDTARVMTGLPSGDYTYRIEGESGRSEPRNVTVAHHSLTRAFSFFGVGLLVFVATVILVVRGERGQ